MTSLATGQRAKAKKNPEKNEFTLFYVKQIFSETI